METLLFKNIDIAFFSETFLESADNMITSIIKSYSYKLVHSSQFGNHKGTAIVIHSNLNILKIDVNIADQYCSFDAVAIVLTNAPKIKLISFYRWNKWSSSHIHSFMTDLENFLEFPS